MTDTNTEELGNGATTQAPETEATETKVEETTVPETKPEETTSDVKDADDGGNATEKEPEGIDFDKIKLPEGIKVTDEGKESILKDLHDAGIETLDGAQKFIDWVQSKSKAENERLANQHKKEVDDLNNNWQDSLKKDPDFGKEYDKNIASVDEIISKYADKETIEFFKNSSFRNNPGFNKMMLRIAKEFEDPTLVTGKKANSVSAPKRDSYGRPMLQFNS